MTNSVDSSLSLCSATSISNQRAHQQSGHGDINSRAHTSLHQFIFSRIPVQPQYNFKISTISQFDRYLLKCFISTQASKSSPKLQHSFPNFQFQSHHCCSNKTSDVEMKLHSKLLITKKVSLVHSECCMLPLLYNPNHSEHMQDFTAHIDQIHTGSQPKETPHAGHLPTKPRQEFRVRFKCSTEGTENL